MSRSKNAFNEPALATSQRSSAARAQFRTVMCTARDNFLWACGRVRGMSLSFELLGANALDVRAIRGRTSSIINFDPGAVHMASCARRYPDLMFSTLCGRGCLR